MLKWITKRVLIMIPLLLLITFVIFLMISGLPGARQEFTYWGGGDVLDAFFARIDATDNQLTQFIRYIFNTLTWDGVRKDNMGFWAISQNLFYRLNNTLFIAALGAAFSIVLGIPLGLLAALRQNRWQDTAINGAVTLIASIPPFCLALFLVLLLAVQLRVVPVFGVFTWQGYVIPTIVLGAGGAAIAARMTRASVLDILSQPYIVTLQAKGLTNNRIVWLHVMKNALVPIISVVNNIVIYVLCSTLIVENFFTIPGIGEYLLSAVSGRKQSRVVGCAIVLALLIMVINLVTDILYALADPHMRQKKAASKKKGGRAS